MYMGAWRRYTGVSQNIHAYVCVQGHACVGMFLPDKNAPVHVQGDVVGARTAVGLPVGLGVAVCQLAGPVRVGGHLYLLPALVLLHLHTGAWGWGAGVAVTAWLVEREDRQGTGRTNTGVQARESRWGHRPWQRCLRNTSKNGMLMG